MSARKPEQYSSLTKRRYPTAGKTCDLALGDIPDWALEVKLARVRRDNGTYENTAVKKILSPYADDRSAVTDCVKLAMSGFLGTNGAPNLGLEDPDRPLHG